MNPNDQLAELRGAMGHLLCAANLLDGVDGRMPGIRTNNEAAQLREMERHLREVAGRIRHQADERSGAK